MGLRHRHDHDDTPHLRFRMQTRLLSVGDDYWIEDGNRNRVFLVDGKAVRFRDTWELKDADRQVVAEIKTPTGSRLRGERTRG